MFHNEDIFERPGPTTLNVLPLRKCPSDRNKERSEGAKPGEYGGCGSTTHINDLPALRFVLQSVLENKPSVYQSTTHST